MGADVITDPLAGGFYTAAETARLLQVDNARRIRGWITGYSWRSTGPVLARDYEPVDNAVALSFWDLMEIRFLEHFRKQSFPLQTLRKVAVNARRELNAKHPFAMSRVLFLSDRKRIFLQTAEETGDKKTLNLISNQFEIYEAIEEVLDKGVSFNASTGLADSWKPLDDCPNVIIHPKIAFGHPTIAGKGVSVSAILRTWKAENGNRDRTAKWFGLDRSHVDEAIYFHHRLAA